MPTILYIEANYYNILPVLATGGFELYREVDPESQHNLEHCQQVAEGWVGRGQNVYKTLGFISKCLIYSSFIA